MWNKHYSKVKMVYENDLFWEIFDELPNVDKEIFIQIIC